MKNLIKGLLSVVEHLAESHTFRSESTAAKVQETLADTRAALDAMPDAPAPAPAETPANPTSPTVSEAAVVPTGTDAAASDSVPGSSNAS